MKTFAFISSDKNSGKTTVFNYIYQQVLLQKKQVCLTSIGINGESTDEFGGGKKPEIRICKNTYFVTSEKYLKKLTGRYMVISVLNGLHKPYMLVRALSEFNSILEGPNTGIELKQLKKILNKLEIADILLIDGSIDRQFLAQPEISDELFLALLLSGNKQQESRARELVYSLSLAQCDDCIAEVVTERINKRTRCLLFTGDEKHLEVIYHGQDIPSLDDKLKKIILEYQQNSLYLYLNGAFSSSLAMFFAPFTKMKVVLDNFTLYRNILDCKGQGVGCFHPEVQILNPVRIAALFFRQENDFVKDGKGLSSELCKLIPQSIPVYNLFRAFPKSNFF